MKNCLALGLLLFVCSISVRAQELRLFLDVPSIYAHSPQLDAITTNSGLGMDVGFGMGTHNLMTKFSGGTTVTANFESDEIEETVLWGPFLRLEAGAGLWRTNGNQCSQHHSNAFSAIGKGAIVYAFEPKEIQYTVGAEFSYFRIRDYFKNMEIFLDAGYNVTTSLPYANFGFRNFLNLRT
ncbi:MAG: hypothetical protein KA479_03265 [Saprospiraceae bacterium]|jgi:hypothetical protein|nr:hypothetical protein [Saprospiraceae bacterium]